MELSQYAYKFNSALSKVLSALKKYEGSYFNKETYYT